MVEIVKRHTVVADRQFGGKMFSPRQKSDYTTGFFLFCFSPGPWHDHFQVSHTSSTSCQLNLMAMDFWQQIIWFGAGLSISVFIRTDWIELRDNRALHFFHWTAKVPEWFLSVPIVIIYWMAWLIHIFKQIVRLCKKS